MRWGEERIAMFDRSGYKLDLRWERERGELDVDRFKVGQIGL